MTMTPKPSPLGLKRSFGFGDRLGLATPGHLAAARGSGFSGIFAQQSIREMTRTERTPEAVMKAAVDALNTAGYDQPWGADADHLKTTEDVEVTAAAGFCFFTIDPSAFVNNAADHAPEAELVDEAARQTQERIYGDQSPEALYLGKRYDLGEFSLCFEREPLLRASMKYGRAIAHCEFMAGEIDRILAGRPYEIEVSVDETDAPTTPLEHLFFALELKRRGIRIVSLAPRFIGEFEKGIDYKGDLAVFEKTLRQHHAIAQTFGPYKISIHSGSDKFSIYPVIGRVCGDLLHVKTAGTSYLEALRVVARVEPKLFSEIIAYAGTRFREDKASYHISVRDEDLPGLLRTSASDQERVFLDEDHGRQVLHVTFGSVLTRGVTAQGQTMREALLGILEREPDLHASILEKHLGRHLQLLNAG